MDPVTITVPVLCLQATSTGRSWATGRGRLRHRAGGQQCPFISHFFKDRLFSIHWILSRPRRHYTFSVVARDPFVPSFGALVNQPRAPLFWVVWSCLVQICGPQPSLFANSPAFFLVTEPCLVAASNSRICHHSSLRHHPYSAVAFTPIVAPS